MSLVTQSERDPRLAALVQWLEDELGLRGALVAPASEDASFRRYFRVTHGDLSYVVMDAPPEREALEPFLAVAALLEGLGVHVPHVYAVERTQGFVLLSDLGSRLYLAELNSGGDAPRLYADATEAMLKMQAAPAAALEGLPPYDAAALDREVQLFPSWFLSRHLEVTLSAETRDFMDGVSRQLAAAALEQPQVLVHRDYHSRNLMVRLDNNPGVLDFQDAVCGALTYDPVSLFKDCYIVWPRSTVLEWLEAHRLAARRLGLAVPGQDDYVRWFDLMGVQRHLKVLGIFARLWYRDGKPGYLKDLPRVLNYVLEATPRYGELAALDRFFKDVVVPGFAAAQARAGA